MNRQRKRDAEDMFLQVKGEGRIRLRADWGRASIFSGSFSPRTAPRSANQKTI